MRLLTLIIVASLASAAGCAEAARSVSDTADALADDTEAAVDTAPADTSSADVGADTVVPDTTRPDTATTDTLDADTVDAVEPGPTVHEANRIVVPMGGNSWVIGGGGTVTDDGVEAWVGPTSVIRTFLRVERAGTLLVSVLLRAPDAASQFTVSVGGASRPAVVVAGAGDQELFVGAFSVAAEGYVAVDLTPVSRAGQTFGRPSALAVSGTAVTAGMNYVHDNEGSMFHWGRRGPSVHLGWNMPAGLTARWMYSELTVPAGQDVVGSYYMANGFDGGYFGMQVNGPNLRRFLFSIWSPYETDDPSTIPDDYKIVLNRKGPGVVVGEFGNEGSGGQSRLDFMWAAGTRYRFLTEVRPVGDGSTDFTAWVDIPEEGGWRLIASFRRPHTDTPVRGAYSFLENFAPEGGNLTRMAHYERQWLADAAGTWSEVRNLTFTVDDTGRRGFRKDFAGGVAEGVPFLKMGGFFNDWVAPDTALSRPATGFVPVVDLTTLP